jgi:hypothetical protein
MTTSENEHATAEFIMKVYHDFNQIIVPSNVWGAFYTLGLDVDTRREPRLLSFDEEKPRGRAGFRELWCVYFPLDEMLSRQRIARFDWIHKPE